MSDWEASEGEHWATNADRYIRRLAAFGDIVSTAAAYAPEERVRDVGCGNGDLTLRAARAVGEFGSAHGVDLSPAMLSVASGRAGDAGLSNVTFDTADAATFQPDAAGFDVVVSRFGVMFFDDPTAAFAHIRSLMAPGGRLAFVCWQDLFANDWMIVPGAAVAEVLPLPVGDDPTAPGRLRSPRPTGSPASSPPQGSPIPQRHRPPLSFGWATTPPMRRASCAPPVSDAPCSLTLLPISRRRRWPGPLLRWFPTSRPREC